MAADKTLVVVGQGMVGYKLLECLVENGATDTWRVVAFGEEPRAAYDRVSLSTYFTGRTAEDLSPGRSRRARTIPRSSSSPAIR